jgi:hypothetical protein
VRARVHVVDRGRDVELLAHDFKDGVSLPASGF